MVWSRSYAGMSQAVRGLHKSPFYYRSPIEVLQIVLDIVLDRPLHDHELADAVELLQQSTTAPSSSADGTLDTES